MLNRTVRMGIIGSSLWLALNAVATAQYFDVSQAAGTIRTRHSGNWSCGSQRDADRHPDVTSTFGESCDRGEGFGTIEGSP